MIKMTDYIVVVTMKATLTRRLFLRTFTSRLANILTRSTDHTRKAHSIRCLYQQQLRTALFSQHTVQIQDLERKVVQSFAANGGNQHYLGGLPFRPRESI